MKPLSFNKTDKDVLDILKKIENRLIIKKNNKQTAKIYFDYDKDTRLEIISTHNVYHCNVPFTGDNEILVNTDNLSVFGDPNNEDDIYVGSLVSDKSDNLDKTNIGVISKIEGNKVTITLIYSPHTITWNDYE